MLAVLTKDKTGFGPEYRVRSFARIATQVWARTLSHWHLQTVSSVPRGDLKMHFSLIPSISHRSEYFS